MFWGWGKPNNNIFVKVSWQKDKKYSGVVSSKGEWKITIPTPSFGGPHKVTITDGEKTIEYNDVFIGEVWLASGQSNMSMPLKGYYCQPVEGSTEAILSASKNKYISLIFLL